VLLAPVVLAWMVAAVGSPVNPDHIPLPLTVTCMNTGSVDGHADYGTYDGNTFTGPIRIKINTPVCKTANRFVRKPRLRPNNDSQRDPAWALFVITHEPQHIAHPFYSEAEADCAALAQIKPFARALGASRVTALRIYLRARWWANQEPKIYRSRCTAGTSFRIRTPPGVRTHHTGS
jgi:hypothetical protein